MSLISSKNHNIDIFCSYAPLPKNINLLDKIEVIQYNGIRIPRIPIGKNNSLNLEKLLYGTIQYYDLYESKVIDNDIFSQDKYLYINNNEDKFDNLNFNNKEEINTYNNDKIKIYKLNSLEYLFAKNNIASNIIPNQTIIKDHENRKLLPSEKFKLIIKNNINNNRNHLDIKNNYNINDINKVILNNINNINLLYNNNILSSYISQKPINKNENIDNQNYYFHPFSGIYNLENDLNSFSTFILNGNKTKNSKIIFKVNTPTILNKIMESKIIIPKRGRKQTKFNKLNKRVHCASDDDNILRKIQVHFLSFLTNYINDIIRVFIIDKNVPLFKNMDYQIKKNVRHKCVEEMKSKSIGEILQLRVSPKLKNHDDSVNRNIYIRVCSLCPFMELYLQRSFLSLFKEYYYNKNKIFIVNGRIIPLSIKTKIFNDLINKNYAYKEKLKYIAVKYFLTNHKKLKKPNFFVNKNKIKKEEKG